ncbi:hypothetical protein ACQ4PT_056009 [Festuca glaucescens]
MSSPNRVEERTPFQDISNTHALDPKELKRQRDREHYARNKDEIQKRRRQARENKQASTTVLNDAQIVQHTPVAMSQIQSHDVTPSAAAAATGECTTVQDISNSHCSSPQELKRQLERVRYSQNRDNILKRQRQSYTQRKMAAGKADSNGHEDDTQTPVSITIDPKEIRRQRDKRRYA